MVRRPLGFTLAAALAALLPQALPAAPHLVKDLNTRPYFGGLLAAEPRGFSQAASYFTVDDPVHGIELWRTDGTSGGTERVTDICAGAGYCGLGPSAITVHAGREYFMADDGFSGQEMWVSDGTPASRASTSSPCRRRGIML